MLLLITFLLEYIVNFASPSEIIDCKLQLINRRSLSDSNSQTQCLVNWSRTHGFHNWSRKPGFNSIFLFNGWISRISQHVLSFNPKKYVSATAMNQSPVLFELSVDTPSREKHFFESFLNWKFTEKHSCSCETIQIDKSKPATDWVTDYISLCELTDIRCFHVFSFQFKIVVKAVNNAIVIGFHFRWRHFSRTEWQTSRKLWY